MKHATFTNLRGWIEEEQKWREEDEIYIAFNWESGVQAIVVVDNHPAVPMARVIVLDEGELDRFVGYYHYPANAKQRAMDMADKCVATY